MRRRLLRRLLPAAAAALIVSAVAAPAPSVASTVIPEWGFYLGEVNGTQQLVHFHLRQDHHITGFTIAEHKPFGDHPIGVHHGKFDHALVTIFGTSGLYGHWTDGTHASGTYGRSSPNGLYGTESHFTVRHILHH